MKKLTLSVDEMVVRRAKRYADAHDTSVSRMVERFLDLVSRRPGEGPPPPVLRRLRGTLKAADVSAYRRHLERKYR